MKDEEEDIDIGFLEGWIRIEMGFVEWKGFGEHGGGQRHSNGQKQST